MNFYFLLIGNETKATVERNRRATGFPIKLQSPPTFVSNVVGYFHGLWIPFMSFLFQTFLFVVFYPPPPFFRFVFFLPHRSRSAWWLVTCRSTNHSWGIPPDKSFVSEGPRRRIRSAVFPHCVHWKRIKKRKRKIATPALLFLHFSYIFVLCGFFWAVQQVPSDLLDVTMIQSRKKKKIPDEDILARRANVDLQTVILIQYNVKWRRRTALGRGGGGGWMSIPHGSEDLLFVVVVYCEGCGAVLSGLLSWAAGGLLLQGALFPRAGELLKSSSSSRPLVASYCVFSRRVIRRSSSSPNSPPISVGSPTTITSCRRRREKQQKAVFKVKKLVFKYYVSIL